MEGLIFAGDMGIINTEQKFYIMSDISEFLRLILFADLFGMLLLAVLFLRERQLSTLGYVCWGIFALMLPVIGPYIVIAYRPGFPMQKD